MSSFNLYASNNLQFLARQLAENITNPNCNNNDPLIPDTLVVQSSGMMKWLSLQLAEHLGIWANFRFLYPNNMVNQIFQLINGEQEDIQQVLSQDSLLWLLWTKLPKLESQLDGGLISDYLAEDTGIKKYELCSQLACLFDQYITYRPDMLLNWEQGKKKLQGDAKWQAALWHLINSDIQPTHKISQRKNLEINLPAQAATLQQQYPRISIFGISSLPPFHLDIFAAVAKYINVDFYWLNPCKEYWADILSNREKYVQLAKIEREKPQQDLEHLEKYFESGNPLLASLGQIGRDLFFLMLSRIDQDTQLYSKEEGSNQASLLALLQSDILHLVERKDHKQSSDFLTERTHPVLNIELDDSLQLSSCHSPMREVEILHDQLLHWFADDDQLTPSDILVMTPNIDLYAPFIDAVFSDHSRHSLPYGLADRRVRHENSQIKTLLTLLEVLQGRFTASDIMALAESKEIAEMFNFDGQSQQRVREWVKNLHIRWASDESMKKQHHLPETPENTWKHGLDRLWAGYAMLTGDIWQSILPYEHIEGLADALALGNFSHFFHSLVDFRQTFLECYTLVEWQNHINQLIETFFNPEARQSSFLIKVREKFLDLSDLAQKYQVLDKMDLPVIASFLQQSIGQSQLDSNFLNGKITFCEMLPMRSIPFHTICLLGMDDGFPRKEHKLSFDLIAQNPRRGDRSKRRDERYLFLETLVSAQRRFYISYVGQSLKDNSQIAPSVIVSELLSYIDQAFRLKEGSGGEPISQALICQHRLHGFHKKYFLLANDEKAKENQLGKTLPPSFFAVNFLSCKALQDKKNDLTPFFDKTLPPLTQEQRDIDVRDFIRFFDNPSKHLLNTRLGIYLDDLLIEAHNEELFIPNKLESYQIDEQIFDFIRQYNLDQNERQKIDSSKLYQVVRAKGLLPHAGPGQKWLESRLDEIMTLFSRASAYLQRPKTNIQPLSLALGDLHISGQLDPLYGGEIFDFRLGNAWSQYQLRFWIKFLLISATIPDMRAIFVAKDKSIQFGYHKQINLTEALEHLRLLANLYILGMTRPLPFFRKASYEFATILYTNSHVNDKVAGNKNQDETSCQNEALKKARAGYIESKYGGGFNDCQDSYVQYLHGSNFPNNEEFMQISKTVYLPLMKYRQEIAYDSQS